MPNTKIATCCYCGTRAALSLRGSTRHELACSRCGAPLSELKMLKSNAGGERELIKPSPLRSPRKPSSKNRPKKSKKRKQRSLAQRMMSGIWDELDDVFDFDDVFDIFD